MCITDSSYSDDDNVEEVMVKILSDDDNVEGNGDNVEEVMVKILKR